MAGNNRVKYNVDIVFCIDCTESMDNILDIVKSRALSFYSDVQNQMKEKNKHIDRLRVRVVAFRDYKAFAEEKAKKLHSNEPMLITDFFELPDEAGKLEISLKSLQPIGGGDTPEDGLEALAYSIRSDWSLSGDKERHVIVLWTDSAPHSLGFAKDTPCYPKGMAKNLDELSEWWGDSEEPGYMPRQNSKRLILFAPDEGAWSYIGTEWDYSIFFPSKAGEGLKDMEYSTILSCIAQTL